MSSTLLLTSHWVLKLLNFLAQKRKLSLNQALNSLQPLSVLPHDGSIKNSLWTNYKFFCWFIHHSEHSSRYIKSSLRAVFTQWSHQTLVNYAAAGLLLVEKSNIFVLKLSYLTYSASYASCLLRGALTAVLLPTIATELRDLRAQLPRLLLSYFKWSFLLELKLLPLIKFLYNRNYTSLLSHNQVNKENNGISKHCIYITTYPQESERTSEQYGEANFCSVQWIKNEEKLYESRYCNL